MSILLAVPWSAIMAAGSCEKVGPGTVLRVQTNRNHIGGSDEEAMTIVSMSEHAKRSGVGQASDDAPRGEKDAAAAAAAAWGSTLYSASTDAGDAVVNFHRPEMFCTAVLQE